MPLASTNRLLRSVVLVASVLLVAVVWRMGLRRDAAPEMGSFAAKASAGTPSPSTPPALAGSAATTPPQARLASAGGPVYLRINELKLVHPAPHAPGHLRANVNA